MKKLLISLSLLTCLALSSCADRERINCPHTKNQVMTRTTQITTPTTTIALDGRC